MKKVYKQIIQFKETLLAIVTITSLFLGGLSFIIGYKLDERFLPINDTLTIINEQQTELQDQLWDQRMSILKIKIWSESLPLDERVKACDEYIGNNGNGSTGRKCENLYEDYVGKGE